MQYDFEVLRKKPLAERVGINELKTQVNNTLIENLQIELREVRKMALKPKVKISELDVNIKTMFTIFVGFWLVIGAVVGFVFTAGNYVYADKQNFNNHVQDFKVMAGQMEYVHNIFKEHENTKK